MNKLEVHEVRKTFGKKNILNEIRFSCSTGEIIGIFGRNGSGKSSLLKILFGTLKTERLRFEINEAKLERSHRWGSSVIIKNQLIGYVPQFSFLPQSLKVWDVIPLYFPNGTDQDKIFNSPRLSTVADQKIGTLSIGERRYLELLLVGNLDHPFLLLDEPFSMVEPLYKEVIHDFLIELKSKKGIILTDHYYHDVWKIADRKMVLKDGILEPVQELKDLVALGYLRSI
tara:strand:- start:672 stop:1355 length:684 start_codon:yes stop_codon:yes gene_type:complete